MATPTYDQLSPDTTAFVDSDNNIQDIQQIMESGNVVVQAVASSSPVPPIGEATTPKYDNITPWVGKFLNSENDIIDLLTWLTSGNIVVQVSGGVAPPDATYITQTDETDTLPDSIPLSGLPTGFLSNETDTGILTPRTLTQTTNQINITNPTGLGGNPVFSLSTTLVTPGSLNVSTSFTIGETTSVTSISNSAATGSATALLTASAVQGAIAAAIVSGNSFRGGYDASGDVFPSTGGSGGGGSIVAGDWWFITVAGTLGGDPVNPGDQIFALVNTPGQTASNWLIVAAKVNSVFGRIGDVVAESGDYSFSLISGTAAATQGGTGQSSYTVGDLLYASTTSALSKLGIGSTGQILTVVEGLPAWANAPADAVSSVFGRTGVVAAAAGDYNQSQISPSFTLVTASTQSLVAGNTYYTTYSGLCTMTLPTTAAAGTVIEVLAGPSGNTFRIAQNASQQIQYGAQNNVLQATTSGTGGYIQSVSPATNVRLVCVVANTTWQVTSNVNYLTGV